jgi:hypothetical protein
MLPFTTIGQLPAPRAALAGVSHRQRLVQAFALISGYAFHSKF